MAAHLLSSTGSASGAADLGTELEAALQSRATGRAVPFRVGIADVVPKAIAWLLLAPSMDLPEPMRIVCREGKFDALLGELAIHKLDVVLADSPLPPNMDVRGFSHALGESTIGFYATPALARTLQGAFPATLDGAPLLLPGIEASVRGPLLRWIEAAGMRPRIVGEFDDSALMQAFGQSGSGIFVAPSVIAEEVCRQYGVTLPDLVAWNNVTDPNPIHVGQTIRVAPSGAAPVAIATPGSAGAVATPVPPSATPSALGQAAWPASTTSPPSSPTASTVAPCPTLSSRMPASLPPFSSTSFGHFTTISACFGNNCVTASATATAAVCSSLKSPARWACASAMAMPPSSA